MGVRTRRFQRTLVMLRASSLSHLCPWRKGTLGAVGPGRDARCGAQPRAPERSPARMRCASPASSLVLRVGWAAARQLGVCILQALPGCCPELWRAAPAGAWLNGGVSDPPLVASLSRLTKAMSEVVRRGEGPQAAPATGLSPAFSVAAEAVCPRADCDLLWWDEPYNNKITSLPKGTRHRVRPHPSGPCWECSLSLLPMGLAGMYDKCLHTPPFSLSTTH